MVVISEQGGLIVAFIPFFLFKLYHQVFIFPYILLLQAYRISLLFLYCHLECSSISDNDSDSYVVATALIDSGRFNVRGRKYHSYGFCSMFLQDLVAGLAMF